MKPEISALNKPPATGCESENIQNQPAAWKIGVECGNENPAPPPETLPKPPGSFYETIYYWLMARP